MTAGHAKGYMCACGTFHKFPTYVYAHTRDLIEHTCESCGAVYEIVMLHATPKNLPKVQTKGKSSARKVDVKPSGSR